MRVSVLGVLSLLLVGAFSPALAEPAGLTAALAPVQTAVDAAALVVDASWPEAERDGTPDEAANMRDQLTAYATALDAEWTMPRNATYRDEVLAALPFVTRVARVVEHVPEDVGALARAIPVCKRDGVLPDEQAGDAIVARQSLNATAREILTLVKDAPDGVDVRALAHAAAALAAWSGDQEAVLACAVAPDLFVLRASPDTAWPSSRVRVSGAAWNASEVRLTAPALGWSATVPVTDRVFVRSFEVPVDAALGTVRVDGATPDERAANVTLSVGKAPVTLRTTAPSSVRVGGQATVTVTVVTPFPEGVGEGHVTLGDEAFPLVNGRATVTRPAPDERGAWSLPFAYSGTDRVNAASRTVTIRVLESAEDVPESAEQRAATTAAARAAALDPFLPALAVAGVIVVLVALAWGARTAYRARRRRGPRRVKRAPTATPAPPGALDVAGLGVVALVSRLVRALRERGVVSASMTAREIGARLDAPGTDAIVPAFERARYRAAEPPAPGLVERAREWARSAWAKVTGGGAA